MLEYWLIWVTGIKALPLIAFALIVLVGSETGGGLYGEHFVREGELGEVF